MKWIAITLVTCIFFCSCDRPECHNTNPIFDKYQPDEKEYKAELVKYLKKENTDYSYWIHSYVNKDGRDYLRVYIQNKNLCAQGLIHFTDSAKILAHFKAVKGVSYRGAELSGLKYHIAEDSGKIEIEFIGLKDIID